jgi:hypothetical protein
MKRVFVAAALAYCVTFTWLMPTVRADSRPSQSQIEFAARSSNLMLATLFAALLQEFAETTPANVEEGNIRSR